ncbi:hypothetical protein [Flagellimonas sp. 2504JD1-5]
MEGRAQSNPPDAFYKFDEIYSVKLDSLYNEYNFWNGCWDVDWQSWKELDKYASSGTPAEHRVFSALDGKAMIELAYHDSISQGSKTAGFSIRYFDSGLEKWVMLQSWPGKNSPNISSLQGTHHHGRIQLYKSGKTTANTKTVPVGTPYVNRYTFSDAMKDSYRWDSSYSTDSMRTWFTNSIAEGTRIADFISLREKWTNYWFTYGDGYNCDSSVLEDIEPFLGEWEGETTYYDTDKKKSKSIRVLMPFLSNCAVLGYQIDELDDGRSNKEILFATYLPKSLEWVFYTLNNIKGKSHTLYFSSSLKNPEVLFSKRDLFDVPSSNVIESLQWKKNDKGEQEILGYSGDGKIIYKKILKKI